MMGGEKIRRKALRWRAGRPRCHLWEISTRFEFRSGRIVSKAIVDVAPGWSWNRWNPQICKPARTHEFGSPPASVQIYSKSPTRSCVSLRQSAFPRVPQAPYKNAARGNERLCGDLLLDPARGASMPPTTRASLSTQEHTYPGVFIATAATPSLTTRSASAGAETAFL